ncbi:MAG TPA: endo-1,4-beta-xylanase [Candidatus Sulfopaludibacter sp.]|nr:endo-1,4-beta-xylanase [Candidatus Sulfopaludibacter sp.]
MVLTLAAAVCVPAAFAQVSLKDAFKNDFRIGAAINQGQFEERDSRGVAIVEAQFNTISPENVLKWESVHPRADGFTFDEADKYVAFGEKNHMFVIGHTLVWHSQTPRWVFEDGAGKPATREMLLDRMHDHIRTVVGRYKGRIGGWDVVNEALNEDGSLRQSQWLKIIGEDYIAKAFQFAHEADPAAELYYNDYSLENEAKRNGAVALIRKLKEQGVPIRAVGLQGHDKLDWPTVEQQDATISAFAKLGVKVNVTELDVDVLPRATQQNTADISVRAQEDARLNPYTAGLPPEMQQALAKRYAELFAVFVKHKADMTRITFWGVTDRDSWLNGFPVRGRTNYPLLFDREGAKKPAFDAVIKTAK